VVLDGCKNLTSLNEVFDVSNATTFDASKFRDVVKNLTVTQSTELKHCDVAGFRFLRRLILRQNGIVSFELQSALPNLETIDLSENPMTRFIASDVISAAPNLKKLVLTNCSNLERVDFTGSSFPSEKSQGLLVSLESLVLDDNPRLAFVCPWFLRCQKLKNFFSSSPTQRPNKLGRLFLASLSSLI